MGFASYLEDIITRVTTIERIAGDDSTFIYKKVDEKEELRDQNQKLREDRMVLRRAIAELQKALQQVKNELTVKDSLLQTAEKKTDGLKTKVTREKDLRQDHEKTTRDLSELVIDYKSRFQVMSEITRANDWHKNSTQIKQLKSIIEAGLRIN